MSRKRRPTRCALVCGVNAASCPEPNSIKDPLLVVGNEEPLNTRIPPLIYKFHDYSRLIYVRPDYDLSTDLIIIISAGTIPCQS